LSACRSAAGDDGPSKAGQPAGAGAAAGGESAARPAATDGRGDKSLREQDIYIPYEKLRQVFEKHGRGVFLPYEKFEELWQAAQDKTRPAAEPRPPVGAVITEIENEAVVAKDVVRVKARVTIDLLAEGWHEVPLRLSDAAITSATLGGGPARIVGGPGEDYRLLVEKKGKKAEQIVLALEYAKAISKMPGQNSVSFQAPQAPVSRWRVRIPQAGVKVNLYPLIAATEVPPAEEKGEKSEKGERGEGKKGERWEGKKDETVVLAFVGAAPMVRIDWTPKAEGATGLAALVSVEADQQVWINEGATRSRTSLTYAISRAELGQLAVEVPADYKVVNVFDANVRQWSVEPAAAGAKRQKITAQLFEPAKTRQQVTVELEKFAGQRPQTSLSVPLVKALDVGRQQGTVVVEVAPGLRAEATRTIGLLQLDASELAGSSRRQSWTFSYRYASLPYELELGVEPLQPRVTADSLVEARLEPERLTLDVTAIYNVERAGIFKLELDVPTGYAVRQVRGCDVASRDPGRRAVAAQVDSHHLEGEKKNRLVVNLSRKALGRVALAVQLQKDLQEANLLLPTGKAADLLLPVPQVPAAGVERAAGRLLIYAPESLLVNPSKTEGLRSISFKEAAEGIDPFRPLGQPVAAHPVLAFAFTQEPVALRLAAERRKPKVTIRQLLSARIEQGVVNYQATFYYTILYSGVKSIRIDVPADVAVRNNTPGLREKVVDPPPADLAKGYVAWSFSGESELLGDGRIKLVWEKKIDKLDIGKSVNLDVPRLVPRGADLAWGQIILAKAETLDVREAGEPKGLRPIDPQHNLMPEANGTPAVRDAAQAFEFYGDWTLAATVTRYQLEDIKRTSIDRAVVRMVVTPAGEVSVQALYRVQSARQRLAVSLPKDAAFDKESLRLDGRTVALERGDKGDFFVPLLGANADQNFLLELRYTVPKDAVPEGGSRLDLPVFPEDAAMQKVYLCVYLPATEALLGAVGPWSEEFRWRLSPSLKWEPRSKVGDGARLAWVREGTATAANPAAEAFPTDGKLYVFSTLRPAAPPDGSLRTTSMSGNWLSAIIFIVVVLGGLLLLPAGLGGRALAVGAGIVLLVLAGVFCPTLSMQLLNGVLVAALVIVLVLWSVSYLAWKQPGELARRRAAPQAESAQWDKIASGLAKQEAAGTPPVESPPPASPAPEEPPKPAKEGGPSNA
jgi:hypothetical protein